MEMDKSIQNLILSTIAPGLNRGLCDWISLDPEKNKIISHTVSQAAE
jgi:hypothetical protein